MYGLLVRRCVVRARSVPITLGAARLVVLCGPRAEARRVVSAASHLAGFLLLLWFCLLLLFLVPRFSAVFDFGQELADMLHLSLGPDVYAKITYRYYFRRWNLLRCDVMH